MLKKTSQLFLDYFKIIFNIISIKKMDKMGCFGVKLKHGRFNMYNKVRA